MGTSGSEGGPGKPTSCKAGRAPRSDPYTYCRTRAGWAYTAFVTDVYARKIVGWKVATEMTQKLVTDAINHAIDTRKRSGATSLESLIHHSDYAEVLVKPRICGDVLRSWELLADFSA